MPSSSLRGGCQHSISTSSQGMHGMDGYPNAVEAAAYSAGLQKGQQMLLLRGFDGLLHALISSIVEFFMSVLWVPIVVQSLPSQWHSSPTGKPSDATPVHTQQLPLTNTAVLWIMLCVSASAVRVCCLIRFSRYPAILARDVEALEAQLSGLADLLGCDLQRACEHGPCGVGDHA